MDLASTMNYGLIKNLSLSAPRVEKFACRSSLQHVLLGTPLNLRTKKILIVLIIRSMRSTNISLLFLLSSLGRSISSAVVLSLQRRIQNCSSFRSQNYEVSTFIGILHQRIKKNCPSFGIQNYEVSIF